MVHISRKLITLILCYLCFVATLVAQCVESHRIATQFDETSPIFTCPGDGKSDFITFQTNLDSVNYFFLFTNQNNLILDFKTNGVIDFERSPRTIFRVYGVAYEGRPTVAVGRNLSNARLASGCFTVSENFIEINISTPMGGHIAVNGQAEALTFCPNDPTTQTVALSHLNTTASQYAYLLMDDNDRITRVATDTLLNIQHLAAGSYKIRGLAYRGNLLDLVGKPLLNTTLATECTGLSENTIALNLQRPNGSTIAAKNTDSGNIVACASNRYLEFTNSDSLDNYAYALIHQNGLILDLLSNGDSLDVNALSPDTYRVLGIAYINEFNLSVGDDFNELFGNGCFALSSNVITLTKTPVEIGNITTDSGITQFKTCATTQFTIETTADSTSNIVYILTTDQQVVQFIAINPKWDLALPSELSRVYAAVYTGDLQLQIGDTLSQVAISSNCFDVSDNFITIQPVPVNGGLIAFRSGEVNYYGCPGELGSNTLSIERSRVARSNLFDYSYLLLDENQVIQSIRTDEFVALSEEMYGTFTVRGVAHLQPLLISVGDTLTDSAVVSTDCFELSGNFLTINWQEPKAGKVFSQADKNIIYSCAEATSTVTFKHQEAIGTNYAYILTKDSIILGYTKNLFQLDTLSAGEYLVYGVSYTGTLEDTLGVNIFHMPLATGCFSLSDEAVQIVRTTPVATLVATTDFQPTINICTNDEAEQLIEVFHTGGNMGVDYAYFLTDVEGNVLNIYQDGNIKIAGNQGGELRIWGASYTGQLTITPGQNITIDRISNECALLSMNTVDVNLSRAKPIPILTFQQMKEVQVCIGDGLTDFIGFYPLERVDANFKFIITDTNNVIIRILNGNIQDFERLGNVTSLVWGVAYTGEFTATVGQNITEITLATGCFSLSENAITITPSRMKAGLVKVNDQSGNISLCGEISDSPIFELSNTSSDAAQYTYFILDKDNNILGSTTSSSINLASFQQAVLKIQGVAHQLALEFTLGERLSSISSIGGCFDLSENQLIIERTLVDGGTVSTPMGELTVYACPTDLRSNIVVLSNNSMANQNYRYVVIDASNKIIAIPNGGLQNFNRFDEGEYRIYGVSFTGALSINVGDILLNNNTLATGCYDLSENFLKVVKTPPTVEAITTATNETNAIAFVGDGIPDSIKFKLKDIFGGAPLIVITNNQDLIIGFSTSPVFDFNHLSVGFYRIYGVAYTGQVTLSTGTNFAGASISDGCFAISNNFVQLICAPGNRNNRPLNVNHNAGIQLSPNPVVHEMYVRYEQPEQTEEVELSIFDVTGRKIWQQQLEASQGINNWLIPVDRLQIGWHVLTLRSQSAIQTIPFLKQSEE